MLPSADNTRLESSGQTSLDWNPLVTPLSTRVIWSKLTPELESVGSGSAAAATSLARIASRSIHTTFSASL